MHAQRSTSLFLFIIITCIVAYTYFSDQNTKKFADQPSTSIITSNEVSNTEVSTSEQIISIDTDLYLLKVDLKGGDIISAELKDQKQDLESDAYFKLLKKQDNFKYYTTNNLVITESNSNDNIENTKYTLNPLYSSEKTHYTFSPNKSDDQADKFKIDLVHVDKSGIKFTKSYTFTENSHVINVEHTLENINKEINVSINSSIIQSKTPEQETNGMFGTAAYRGAAFSTSDTKYSKESFEDIADLKSKEIKSSAQGGWISMIQHYFVTAWIGLSNTSNEIILESLDNNQYAKISILSSPITLQKGTQKATISNKLWIGPKNLTEMESTAPNFELTVDYGWLSFLSIFLFKLLDFINSFTNNWGVSIIIITLIVRGCMYTLTKKQYTSMAKMRLLTPKLNEIKNKYKDDKQKLSQAMMTLYSKEGVNPLGGCLPILIQMPIFIALYWTLMESTELRHSPFFFWIKDLSTYDPYFVFPILMGVTMFIIQKMSPTPVTDPMQKKIFTVMPVIFTLMFCTFPAGLTLYWLVSNIVTIIQQTIIFRHLEKTGLHVKKK